MKYVLYQSIYPALLAPVVVTKVGNTLVKVSDNRVLSWQSNGSWGDRDPGTAGPWETFADNGNIVTYNSDGSIASFALLAIPN